MKDSEWLQSRGIDLTRNPIHDAAGINDDYPTGRGLFMDEFNRFVVLVNFQDHIEVIMLPQTAQQIAPSFKQLKRLMSAFDKVGFACDPYLGHLTTSPKDLGTGFKLQCDLLKT